MRPICILLVTAVGLALWGCGSSATSNSEAPSVPHEYADICGQPQAVCNADESPPNLVGVYTGEGKTLVTSNELWRVGDTSTFKVQITQQVGAQVVGSIDLGTFHLDVEQAQIRGSAQKFSIYGTDSAAKDGCSAEAQGILSGVVADTSASQISGQLILVFTKNIVGQGCKQSQIDGYPGTGATFSYTAMRLP
jgi:hypothetical protein